MVLYSKYVNKTEHIWYDSSNICYSACYDRDEPTKILKIVFKGGRTYLYKDVDVNDYVAFTRGAESNGSECYKHIIKKYSSVRLGDTDLNKLEELKKTFMEENQLIETSMSNLAYAMEINDQTGEFRLKLNGRTIFEGIEGQVSIMNLLNSMHIAYKVEELTTPFKTAEDFEKEELV